MVILLVVGAVTPLTTIVPRRTITLRAMLCRGIHALLLLHLVITLSCGRKPRSAGRLSIDPCPYPEKLMGLLLVCMEIGLTNLAALGSHLG